MSRYDLTETIMRYLDRHQILPLLEFLQEKKAYKSRDLQKAKLDLVSKTKMVDFAIEEYKQLNNTEKVPPEMETQRTTVYNDLSETQKAIGLLLEFVAQEDDPYRLLDERPNSEQLRSDTQKKGVTAEQIAALYPYAKTNFDCGSYELAAKTLQLFRMLSDDEDKKFLALWGKLAAEILMVNCEVALRDLNELRGEIDRRGYNNHLEQLRQRTWLIHWSLFIFFGLEGGLAEMMEFLFQEKLMNTIQTQCPHILRYIVTAVIVNKTRKNVIRDVIKILLSEEGSYSDPFTEFVVATCANFDFDKSAEMLKKCKEVLDIDFFLGSADANITEQFMEGAQVLLLENVCKTQRTIAVSQMATYLGLETDGAEARITQLLRESNVDATLDTATHTINVTGASPSVYTIVMDMAKQRNLDNRSQQLIQQVEKKYQLLEERDA